VKGIKAKKIYRLETENRENGALKTEIRGGRNVEFPLKESGYMTEYSVKTLCPLWLKINN